MFNPIIIKNFLNKDDCEYLINTVKNVDCWEKNHGDFWENRILSDTTIYKDIDKIAGRLLYDVRIKISDVIKKEYKLSKQVYPDLCQVVRWFPGQQQPPHADDMKDTEGHEWYHHRDYGSIIYLNDNYDGGNTYYPKQKLSITPEIGTLLVHPGDQEHFHGVTKIKNSTRYTISSFWTLDKNYHDKWEIV